MQSGQPEAAMKYFQDGLEIAKKLLSANPKGPSPQARFRMFAVQISICGDAIVALGGLDRINSQPTARKPWLLYVRCKMLARQGDLHGVAEAAGKLRSLAGKDADILYFAVAGYGLCVRILETPPVGGTFPPGAKPRELTPEQKAQRQKYVDLAPAPEGRRGRRLPRRQPYPDRRRSQRLAGPAGIPDNRGVDRGEGKVI